MTKINIAAFDLRVDDRFKIAGETYIVSYAKPAGSINEIRIHFFPRAFWTATGRSEQPVGEMFVDKYTMFKIKRKYI